MKTAGFLVISILLITVFAVFGLMASAITQHSNISLLISLCFWLFAAVIIPNTSVFWANKLFPIPTSDEVNRLTNEEISDIYRKHLKGASHVWMEIRSIPVTNFVLSYI